MYVCRYVVCWYTHILEILHTYILVMHCPHCSTDDTAVVDSRLAEDGRAIRRRRECGKCGHRFTTYERQDISSLIVVKRDGTREPYSRSKLERGLWLACTKRPVTQEQIAGLLNKLEDQWSSAGTEVESTKIGSEVMEELRNLDKIAYIRFASVHREFADVEEFKEELGRLLTRKK